MVALKKMDRGQKPTGAAVSRAEPEKNSRCDRRYIVGITNGKINEGPKRAGTMQRFPAQNRKISNNGENDPCALAHVLQSFIDLRGGIENRTRRMRKVSSSRQVTTQDNTRLTKV